MSKNASYLHSHSGIERELKLPKNFVLVDEKYSEMFVDAKLFRHDSRIYYKVPTIEFINKNGVFKNFYE